MHIEAQYHFYFDYLFPSLGPPINLMLELSDNTTAFIQGWDRNEPLFFAEIDESLAGMSMSMQSVEHPDIRIERRVKDVCVDRLRVVLHFETDPPLTEPLLSKSRDTAVDAANAVIDHLRVATRAALLRRIGRYWRLGDESFALLVPHTHTDVD
jgi:hypothetical protein